MLYLIHILIIINIYIIITTSSNLLIGVTNLFSLGQAAFFGIGAYICILALIAMKLPLTIAILFIMVAVSITSLLIAYPSLRLKGDYFVLATLGFQLIVFTVIYNWQSVTGGANGFPNIPRPRLFGFYSIDGLWPFFFFSLILMLLTIFFFSKLIYSPFGRMLKCIRDDEIAVASIGRSTTAFKIWAFIISSSFVGIAGLVYATYISYIDPTSFNIDESLFILAAVLIGGTGNIKGPVLGAVFVIILPEMLRFVGFPNNIASALRQIIYGLIIIVLMRYRPQGICGEYWIER